MRIDGITRAYRDGTHQPTQVVEGALEAAKETASLNTFLFLDSTGARTQAEASTRRWRSGAPLSPLDGVPIAVKDQIDVEGLPTTAGTSFLRRIAKSDAVAVGRMRRAGMVILGKTHMSELGHAPNGLNAHWGAARNPRNRTHDTGGSSSGSAAAVAAGLVPLALGTDLGGSLRIPAALCGVASIKPTFGRVPMEGVLPVAWSLDHLGLIGASVEDARLGLELMCGTRLVSDPLPPRLRVGICERWWRAATAETTDRVEAALLRLGAERVAISLPHIECAFAAGALIHNAEAASALEEFRGQPLSPAVRIALAVGRQIRKAEYHQAQRTGALIAAELAEAFERCDVLSTPTTAYPARAYAPDAFDGELDEKAFRDRTVFTFPANLAGFPAAQVPCDVDGEGLPVGLQVIAPIGEDALALAVAAAVEQSSKCPPPP